MEAGIRPEHLTLYLQVADGNESDKAMFAQWITAYQEQLCLDAVFVADSALHNQANGQAIRWVASGSRQLA